MFALTLSVWAAIVVLHWSLAMGVERNFKYAEDLQGSSELREFYELADLQDIDLQAVIATYTDGFLRAQYTDNSVRPPIFVQAEVLAIGVCYKLRTGGGAKTWPGEIETGDNSAGIALTDGNDGADESDLPGVLAHLPKHRLRKKAASADTSTDTSTDTDPDTETDTSTDTETETVILRRTGDAEGLQSIRDIYRKLVEVTVDKRSNIVIFYYVDYKDSGCRDEIDFFTLEESFKSAVRTDNNVKLKIKWKFTRSERAALRLIPENSRGFQISFFGAEEYCEGEPFKYQVATDRCSSYPDFFGRVECDNNAEELTFLEFRFNSDVRCRGESRVLHVQPFECTNRGSDDYPSYQIAECLQ